MNPSLLDLSASPQVKSSTCFQNESVSKYVTGNGGLIRSVARRALSHSLVCPLSNQMEKRGREPLLM